MKFRPVLKMEQASGGEGGGSGTSTTTTTTQAAGSGVDDFGYATTPPAAVAAPAAAATPPPTATQTANTQTKEDAIPGYEEANEMPAAEVPGYVAPKEGDPPPATTTPPAEGTPAALDYKIEVADLAAEEIKKIEDIALAHKLPKDAAVAMAELRKSDIKAQTDAQSKAVADRAAEISALRSGWIGELKTDKEFGGANFPHSMKKVGTVLDKFFPETKKMLTTHKGMLPPSTMKDLFNMHKVLYSTPALVEGDKGAEVPESKNAYDGFYK